MRSLISRIRLAVQEHWQLKSVMRFMQKYHEVQGPQAFAFSVVTVNDEHRNLSSEESVGVKFQESIYA